uniref:CIA30 domain-containing protein n=1 Tax=Haemonchus placei TaxID=6290 RepID=A0A158QM04_HAEPC
LDIPRRALSVAHRSRSASVSESSENSTAKVSDGTVAAVSAGGDFDLLAAFPIEGVLGDWTARELDADFTSGGAITKAGASGPIRILSRGILTVSFGAVAFEVEGFDSTTFCFTCASFDSLDDNEVRTGADGPAQFAPTPNFSFIRTPFEVTATSSGDASCFSFLLCNFLCPFDRSFSFRCFTLPMCSLCRSFFFFLCFLCFFSPSFTLFSLFSI